MNPLKLFNLEIEKINEKEVLFGVFHIEDKDGVWKNYETRGEKRESEKREARNEKAGGNLDLLTIGC